MPLFVVVVLVIVADGKDLAVTVSVIVDVTGSTSVVVFL